MWRARLVRVHTATVAAFGLGCLLIYVERFVISWRLTNAGSRHDIIELSILFRRCLEAISSRQGDVEVENGVAVDVDRELVLYQVARRAPGEKHPGAEWKTAEAVTACGVCSRVHIR